MPNSPDLPIPVWRKCRATQDIDIWVADYDKIAMRNKTFYAGALFHFNLGILDINAEQKCR
jgi:hypothetical protein